MQSKIAAAIRMELEPVALVWTDEKPEGAMEFVPGKWGCVLFLFVAAAKGKTAVAGRETCGCFGGGVGLGFGEQYKNFPGGEECFCRFLLSGNAGAEPGQSIGQGMAASGAAGMAEDFLLGERYLKSPELVKKFIVSLPVMEIPSRYVTMKPLRDVDLAKDNVRSITFLPTRTSSRLWWCWPTTTASTTRTSSSPSPPVARASASARSGRTSGSDLGRWWGWWICRPQEPAAAARQGRAVAVGHARHVPPDGGERRGQLPPARDMEEPLGVDERLPAAHNTLILQRETSKSLVGRAAAPVPRSAAAWVPVPDRGI